MPTAAAKKTKGTKKQKDAVRSVEPLHPEDDIGVIHLVAEFFPYARTGGLAEAVRGIAGFQTESGIPTTVFMPLYRVVRERTPGIVPHGDPFNVPVGPRNVACQVYVESPAPPGPRVFFVGNPHYFDRAGIYGEGGGDYPDNHLRFAFFTKAVLHALPRVESRRLVVHAHDWHTALAPVYIRTVGQGDPFFDQMATILSVHNAGFQGHFGRDILPEVGLPLELYHWSKMEWYGRVNWLKGGLVFSDFVGTVSHTHATELRSAAGGFGLHEAFVALGDRLVGIRNGIDLHIWDPEHDPDIPAHFSREDLEGKRTCKADLQQAAGLAMEPRKPLIGMTARLVLQKGLDLILDGQLVPKVDAQFIFLGEGEPRYQHALAQLAAQYPDKVAVRFDFTEVREHRLLAGADMLLMPSMYEPCGLTQMRAQRYGALPIARRVGGLSDTIEDQVTGFLFDEYQPAALERAVWRAIDLYRDEEAWQDHMREAMSRDFGWEDSSRRYMSLYRRALQAHTPVG